jgi:hypothetical protein
VNGTNNYYQQFNATLTIYINETTTICNGTAVPPVTYTIVNPQFDVNSTCTSTAIPECHNTWDIVLIVLIIFFGLLALLALIALGWVLLRRYPECDACHCRHRPGNCPLDKPIPAPVNPDNGYYAPGRQQTGLMHDMPEN